MLKILAEKPIISWEWAAYVGIMLNVRVWFDTPLSWILVLTAFILLYRIIYRTRKPKPSKIITPQTMPKPETNPAIEDAIRGLMSLGYRKKDVVPLVEQAAREHDTAEEIIKAVFRK